MVGSRNRRLSKSIFEYGRAGVGSVLLVESVKNRSRPSRVPRLNSATSEHRRRLPHNADDYTMVGDERRDQVRSSLIRIASANFFEGTSSDSFRNELAQSLRHVVDACQLKLLAPALRTGSSSPSITRYDTTALGECLSSIDWKGLCVHLDDHVKDVSKLSTAASTSLPLPLSLLLEP
jgi:hypothetical protein